ncbi:hypothetical protein SAMN02745216_02350 [Desulfatibacillum alkenivorans DSM 16219]|jgi:hypothetical protein|uniref:Lipoprotein n=1 Tax=Desulfatibacillum alkenivorans DSM 16219 TaxID=1121393 RepID=A0A1M6MG74_9BACT|nr:hypothetical protein [Desulfatibacillum alkenivorans]SHJ82376.1 hypothetical protein SAMN02745216_02350 [Desulfatibacillum alkenivorans DSM 16219]
MKRVLLPLILSIILAGCVAAPMTTADVRGLEAQAQWGDEVLMIPAPANFHEAAANYPEMKRVFERMIPPGRRLLAGMVSDEDYREVQKSGVVRTDLWMLMQAPKGAEKRPIAKANFQDVVKLVRKGDVASPAKRVEESTQVSRAISRDLGYQVKIRDVELKVLETFLNQDDANGILQIGDCQVQMEGQIVKFQIIIGDILIWVKDAIVSGQIAKLNPSREDLEWVKAKSLEWADLILKANGEKGLES